MSKTLNAITTLQTEHEKVPCNNWPNKIGRYNVEINEAIIKDIKSKAIRYICSEN